MEYYFNKSIVGMHYSKIVYYCPEQVIEGLVAELQGRKYKYHDEADWFNGGHFFWFIITDTGECGIISGMDFNAWHLKNVFENDFKPAGHPILPKKFEKVFKEFIENAIKKSA